MTATHVHLFLNHVPILATLFGLGLLLYAALRRSDEVARVALGFFVVAALVAVPVYLTGGRAEETVEELPGVTEAVIEPHEEAGEIALWSSAALGVLALGTLVATRRRERLPRWAVPVAIGLSALVGGWFVYTGSLGGTIRHTEIRASAQTSAPAPDARAEDADGD